MNVFVIVAEVMYKSDISNNDTYLIMIGNITV